MGSGRFIHSRQSRVNLRLLRVGTTFSLIVLLIINCGKSADNNARSVSVQELSSLIQSGKELFLLDVRTEPEYTQAHLEATDKRIPYDQLKPNLELLPADKNTAIYCFCRTGHRSGIAADYLVSIGYKNVYNVEGGIVAWQNKGYEVVSGP